jgi:hypothetical protein
MRLPVPGFGLRCTFEITMRTTGFGLARVPPGDLPGWRDGASPHGRTQAPQGQRNLEQRVVVDERDIDSAGITGVGVDHRVTPRAGNVAFTRPMSRSTTKRFSTSQTPSKSGPKPVFIIGINEASWSIRRSRSCGVQPAMLSLIARNTLSVRRPSATAFSSSS